MVLSPDTKGLLNIGETTGLTRVEINRNVHIANVPKLAKKRLHFIRSKLAFYAFQVKN